MNQHYAEGYNQAILNVIKGLREFANDIEALYIPSGNHEFWKGTYTLEAINACINRISYMRQENEIPIQENVSNDMLKDLLNLTVSFVEIYGSPLRKQCYDLRNQYNLEK